MENNLFALSSAQPLLVTVTDLKRELESLHYMEHKRLAIQGQITAVRYMRRPKSTQCLEREEVFKICSRLLFNTEHQSSLMSQVSYSRCHVLMLMNVNAVCQRHKLLRQQLSRHQRPV